jgi:ribosomal protein S27E
MVMFRADFEHELCRRTPKVRYVVSGHKCVRCHGCEHEDVLKNVSKTVVLRQICANLIYLWLYSPF